MLKDTLIDYDEATGRVSHTPRQVFLELTGKCNLACVHCSKDYGSDEARFEQHMGLDVIEKIHPWIDNARFLNLNLVGEPMMAPHFERVIRRTRDSDTEVSFNTNGLYLDEAQSKFLVENRVNSISVSIDGTKFNRRVRGVPYEAIVQRVETFDRVRREMGSELPHLAFAYTLFRDNVGELKELLQETLPRMRVHAVHVQPLIVFYETLRQQNAYTAPGIDALISDCRELCARYGTELVLFRSQFVQDERFGSAQELVRELGPYSSEYGCTDPFFEIKVRADGGILACANGLEPGGNVLRESLDDIWNGEWYRGLRQKLYSSTFEGRCQSCPYLFGSLENQLSPLRPGVHHSMAARFLGTDREQPGSPEPQSFEAMD